LQIGAAKWGKERRKRRLLSFLRTCPWSKYSGSIGIEGAAGSRDVQKPITALAVKHRKYAPKSTVFLTMNGRNASTIRGRRIQNSIGTMGTYNQ